jgi:hypothetical protein
MGENSSINLQGGDHPSMFMKEKPSTSHDGENMHES